MATFRALADEADFSNSTPHAEMPGQQNGLQTPTAEHAPQVTSAPKFTGGPAVHIDIQIHISPESTPQQIDKIFENMAKRLYGRKGDE